MRSISEKRASIWVWARLEAKDIYGGKHIVGMAAEWVPDGFPQGPEFDLMWSAGFRAVFHPAYHYREHHPAKKP